MDPAIQGCWGQGHVWAGVVVCGSAKGGAGRLGRLVRSGVLQPVSTGFEPGKAGARESHQRMTRGTAHEDQR